METNKHVRRTEGFVKAIPEDVEKTRTILFTISKATRDRHRTVLDLEGWDLDNYNRNPIVGYQHNVYGDSWFNDPDPKFIIGIGRAFLDQNERALMGEIKFEPKEINELAENLFRKVLFGSLRATSVGFLPKGKGKYGEGDEAMDGKTPTYYYGKRDLLEYSLVNIPSNPDALKRSMEEQKEELYDHIRDVLGERFTKEVIDKMTIGELLKEKESEREVEESGKTVIDYIRKIDYDLLKIDLLKLKIE